MVERYLPVCMLLSCFSLFSAVSRNKAGNKLQQNQALTWYQDKDFNRLLDNLNFSALKLLFKVPSKANRGDSWSTEHKLCKLLSGRLPSAQCLNLLLSDSASSLQRLNAAFIRDPVRLNKDFVTLGGMQQKRGNVTQHGLWSSLLPFLLLHRRLESALFPLVSV